MKVKCYFLWQAQHLVNVGMQDWAPKIAFYNRKCSWGARKVTSLARRVAVFVFMVGSLFFANFCQMLSGHFA